MNKNLFVDTEVVDFFMRKRGISVGELAGKMEMGQGALENLLNGADQSSLPGTLPWRFAHALGVPVKMLLRKYYND